MQVIDVREPTCKPTKIDCQMFKIGIMYRRPTNTDVYCGTPMTSIFEGQPPKTRPFSIKTRVIWVPGYIYIYISYIYICMFNIANLDACFSMDCFNGWFYDQQNHFQGNLPEPFFVGFRCGPWLPPFQQVGSSCETTIRDPWFQWWTNTLKALGNLWDEMMLFHWCFW